MEEPLKSHFIYKGPRFEILDLLNISKGIIYVHKISSAHRVVFGGF